MAHGILAPSPDPGLNACPLALAGRFFTSGPPGKSQNSAESLPHTCRPVSLPGGERRASTHRLFPPCLQIEMLSPLEAVVSRFREQYKTFATALDTTRHELPVKSVHLDGDRQLFLGESWAAAGQGAGQVTAACWHLLGPGSLYPSVSCPRPPHKEMVCPPSNGRGCGGPVRLTFAQGRVLSQSCVGI